MRRFFVGQITLDLLKSAQTQYQNSVALSDLSIGDVFSLPDTVYHHWIRVLRAQLGDQSILFDGLGGQSVVELSIIDKKSAQVTVLEHHLIDNTSPYYTTVALVMSRGDRMDYAIQKATELGVTAIQLLTSQHGEVRLKPQQVAKKMSHWQQVALSACEQCGLNRPPLIFSPIAMMDWLTLSTAACSSESSDSSHSKTDNLFDYKNLDSSIEYLGCDPYYQNYSQTLPLQLVLAVPEKHDSIVYPNALITNYFSRKKLSIYDEIGKVEEINQLDTERLPTSCDDNTSLQSQQRIDLLIGAEGGFSTEEYHQARQHNFTPWQIGPRVLRTETAPVVALTALLYLSGQLNHE